MRYFKIVLACFGFIFTVVGITVGVMFLTGKFDKEVIQPNDIAFDITEKLTEDDFEVVLSSTTENVTEKDVTLSLTNQTEKDGYITDGVVTVPKNVKLGKPFVVQVNKTHYDGLDEEWNVGGTSVIRAKSTNPLIQEATPLTVEVDVPVHSLDVDLVSTTGIKLGTVASQNAKGVLKTLAGGNKDVFELAVGSVVRLKPVFIPAKSGKTTKGEDRKVIFEIPTAWRGIHIDFVDGENDLIEILRQTTIEEIKINAYCFKTSADEYATKQAGYSDEELITMMSENGIKGQSHQIFGTNQKITSFTSSTKNEHINLAINSPLTLLASGTTEGAFDLGLAIASDAGVARLEDKIAVIKLYAYSQDALGNWEDAGDKLLIVGQTSSDKANGVRAKINKKDSNLSSWKVIASETGKYKLVAKLSYEYYSSSSSTPTIINFEIEYKNILVSDPVSTDVSWKNTLPAIKTLIILDGETAAEKYYPTLNLYDYVDIKNPNATYKAVRFFAYSTERANLKDILDCTLYDGNFAVPDSSETYEVFEIPNGILTVKDVGTFRIFFATIVSDYLGNPKLQFEQYLFESYSNTNTINVVKSLKTLDASMTVNVGEEGKEYNKNTDENTKDHVFHVRQQDENVFTLSLFVGDIEIFERDYADGKIHIDFLLAGEKSNILKLSDTYSVDYENKRIDFQVSVKALPDNNEPTLECKITYDLDHRLDKFVSNNGNKVQIKVLNGFAQEIYFDAVKDATPKNSASNPIQVEIKFNAGSDNVATNVEYEITLNGTNLLLADLSKVSVNEEALNKTYTLASNKPAIIAIEDSLEEGAKLSILGSTQDEDVIVTATAADGSEISTSLYFKVKASRQITLTPSASEIVVDGYQGNTINFRSYFDAKAEEIDLNNLLNYNVVIDDASKFAFADDTLRIVSTLGRDTSLQLYVTSDFGFTKVIPIRIASCISVSTNVAFNDLGLDDKDFVEREEEIPTERGTRVYAENTREITFVLTQEKPTSTPITVSADDFEFASGDDIELTYSSGILSVKFAAVEKMTEKTITFRKRFSENDQYAFVYTMKFLVFPNIKSSLTTDFGTQQKPVDYKNGETVIYDAKDNARGLIKLERILGSSTISEHATIQAKLNGEWQSLASSDGKFMLPSSYRALDGGFVDVRAIYEGCVLEPIRIHLNPFFDETLLLDAKLLYDGKHYIPFIAKGNNPIALVEADGVTYSIANGTSEQYIRIKSNQIEKLDKLYTKIITTEKLVIQNNNGQKELPIIILPIGYPFVAYSSIENSSLQETYRTVDLKQVIESESIYDTIEAGGDEFVDLHDKLLVEGLDENGVIITITNADETTNSYVNFDPQTLKLTANSVGKDKLININVKCGAEFEEAYSFVYRIKITANQHIEVFYPYVEYNEAYDSNKSYEYLYFDGKSQVKVDLLEEFDVLNTPNKAILDELFETTDGTSYARRFVVVREKDEKLIPTSNKDLHFEIANIMIGGKLIAEDKVSDYAIITEKTSTSGELESAELFVNKGLATQKIYVTIRAFTTSGAEAFYRFQVIDKKVEYKVYYENKELESDDFSVASKGESEVNLNEKILILTTENPIQQVEPNSYKFYMIIHNPEGTDYSQFISLNGGIITMNSLVNNVDTTIVIYNAMGEISRFKLTLKCTIDHEIKSSTIGQDSTYDIGKNIEFFNSTDAKNNYSMEEISTTLFVRNFLNDSVSDDSEPNNLFREIGGYSIKDISKQYNQYVILDNIKIYAENMVDIWEGKFFLGDEARYSIKNDEGKEYITYNDSQIYIQGSEGNKYVPVPVSTTAVTYDVVHYRVEDGAEFVVIPHFKFAKGELRDFVLFDYIEFNDGTTEYHPYQTDAKVNEKNHGTYVYECFDNNFIRYKVSKTSTGELKVAMLRLTHNNKQYIAKVDNNNHEYIVDDNDVKQYFTRFYQINYSGLSEYELDDEGEIRYEDEEKTKPLNNVPYIRYMISKSDYAQEKITIDFSKILFFTQSSQNKILNLGKYQANMFKFFYIKTLKNGETEETEIFTDNNKKNNEFNWTQEFDKETKSIPVVIKDKTGNFVVGRFTIVPTIETSTSTSVNNKTLVISAGDTNLIDYTINDGKISLAQYKDAMGSDFTGVASTDHEDWTKYLYDVSSNEYKEGLDIGNDGQITGLQGKNPWGDITVDAKLQYTVNKTLTTSISFETWRNEIFGTDSTMTYSDLTTEKIVVKCFDEEAKEKGSIDDNSGDIALPYGDYKVTITLGKKCPCGKFVTLGTSDTHTHDYEIKETPTETYTSLDNLGDYSSYFGTLNTLKSVVVPGVGKIALTGNLTQQDGTWKLSEGGKIELFEYGKEVTFEATSPFTKTITQNLEDSKTITLPQGATNPSIETEGISGSYDADTRTYTFGDEVAIGTEISIKYYYPINNNLVKQIDPYNISSEFKNLFPQGVINYAFTGIESDDDKTWSKFLEKCTVKVNGQKLTETTTTLGDGATTQFSFIITTNAAAHTGTFYIVNEEADKSTVHAKGNLDKINNSLSSDKSTDGTSDKVVSAGKIGDTTYWVLPMATQKTLTKEISSTEGDDKKSGADTLRKTIEDSFGISVGDCSFGFGENQYPFEELIKRGLSTAAELKNGDKLPFNTITVYHNNYAIGKIHIYLKDFDGDKSGDPLICWKIAEKTLDKDGETDVFHIDGELGQETEGGFTEEGNATLKFVITSDERAVKYLTTTLNWTETVEGKNVEHIEFLTQNVQMDNDEHIFNNGLRVQYVNSTLILQMTKRNSVDNMFKFEFEEKTFKFELQDSDTIDMNASYYEGLVDLIKQPSSDSREEGERVYKAEKTGDSNVVYKDRIVGTDLNFDKWEYITSYEDENGQTHEGIGKEVSIHNLGGEKKLKIVVNNIQNDQGDSVGGYTFFVDLNKTADVTIIGGDNATMTSPSDPIDGGSIAAGQKTQVSLKDSVFEIHAQERVVEIEDYLGELTNENKEEEILNALFDKGELSYLRGVWSVDGEEKASSTVFKISKDDSNNLIVSIVFNNVAFKITKGAGNFTLEDCSKLGDGEFTLKLNKNLYDFDASISDIGSSSAESSSEESSESKKLTITISPIFTFAYTIENNSNSISVTESEQDESEVSRFDFEQDGKLKITGKSIQVATTVQFKFIAFRGKGDERKEVAVAYYNLTIKPSFTATITYPTISIKAEGENGEMTPTSKNMTTELFYAGTGVFDVNEAADLSINHTPRIAVTKHAYGTATKVTPSGVVSTPCEVIYESNPAGGTIKKIKIGDGNWKECESATFTGQGDVSATISDYTISLYIPRFTVQYTASSKQPIIVSEGATATSATNDDGKFSFSFGSLSIAQADVIISVQAGELDDSDEPIAGTWFTFGQYKLTVFKDPVITLKLTTNLDRMESNCEILPINGSSDLQPFDTTQSSGYVKGTPRVQFVYDNSFLSDGYLNQIKAFKVGESSGVKLTSFSVSCNTIEEGEVSFKYGSQDISGIYKYATKWDYKLNPVGLNTSEIEGVEDPDNSPNPLTYYELKAGKTYDFINTFGITKYFGEKDKNYFKNLFVEFDSAETGIEKYAQISSDGKSLIVVGAPTGGKPFKVKIYPFGETVGTSKTIGIIIVPAFKFSINYQQQTSINNITYGIITEASLTDNAYSLVKDGKSNDFSINIDGVEKVIEGFTFNIQSNDGVNNLRIEGTKQATNTDWSLKIEDFPQFNSKQIVIKVFDQYGFVEYLRYVVEAKTPVDFSTSDITLETGKKIEWTSEQPFPIQFKKQGESGFQRTSFYEAVIVGAQETKVDGITKSNVSDTYGSESSLRATTETDGKLYGVQLDSVITKTTTDESGKTTKSYYIPFEEGSPISFNTYKLIAVDKDGKVITLKSFDTYKNYYFKITCYKESPTESVTLGSENIPKTMLSESGAFTPLKYSSQSYYTNYKIEFYKTKPAEESTKADVTIAFNALKVKKTDNLYYASRENPDDCYEFSYSIKVEGQELVESTGKIKNVGNKQYGSASALNTTLKVSVYNSKTSVFLDTVDVGILLKFGIYPKITQKHSALTSYDYVGLGDDIKSKLDGLTGGTKPSITLVGADGANAPTYYKVLGDDFSSISEPYPAQSMSNGTLTSNVEYEYNSTSRILTLKTPLSSNVATLNNIKYTFTPEGANTPAKLTIGYKIVDLTKSQTTNNGSTTTTYSYVDEAEGITYEVSDSTLQISKEIDSFGKARINNKEYTVNSTTTVTYTTLYESIFVVWEYESNTYWGQWNYKVVDKFNSVIAGNHVSVADGTFNVKLDWVDANGEWRFNANTWVLTDSSNSGNIKNYNVSYKDTDGTAGYYVTIGGTEYEIVVSADGKMTFQAENGAKYPNTSTSGEGSTATALELTEEKTTNSSWADAIILTGLDGETTSLKKALDDNKVSLKVNSETLSSSDNVAITSESTLSGKNYSINISYVGIAGGTGETLKINGKDIILSFSSMF